VDWNGDEAIGAVLAGGTGSRLGGAKALAELGGEPLIARPLAAVRKAGLEPVVVAKPGTELPPLDCRVLREPEQPRHPLCGIVAALREAGGRAVVAGACDMPFAAPALLAALAAAPERLVVPAPSGEAHPLLARYGPELLPDLEAALAREEPLRRTVASLSPRLLDRAELARFGDPGRLLFNVNDPDDLEQAARIQAEQHSGASYPRPGAHKSHRCQGDA
jgi:molybdopterin-guanine dinucleotide biosynthesis protein A